MEKGVNIIGYSRAEFGLGEACRLAAKSFQAVGIPFCIVNFPYSPARQNDLTWKHKEVEKPIYQTNLFMINADQLYYYYRKNLLKRHWFHHRYNIGYWHWELPEFPSFWRRSFHIINEIWTPSKFTADSIGKKTSKPVVIMPHGVSLELASNFNRKYYGLPLNSFLFLSMFDMHSTSVRKNPIGAIESFKKAFNEQDLSVGLVIKVNNASDFPDELEKLNRLIKGYQNIYILNKIYSRQEINGLINSTDCLISLHRSEGFGLPMAEAMYLGKPVIATNWSGNVDFMNKNNACLVDFTLSNIDSNYGPYQKNQHWAEPNINEAVEYMKKLVSGKKFVHNIGEKAKLEIEKQLNHQIVGEKYKFRLQDLKLI